MCQFSPLNSIVNIVYAMVHSPEQFCKYCVLSPDMFYKYCVCFSSGPKKAKEGSRYKYFESSAPAKQGDTTMLTSRNDIFFSDGKNTLYIKKQL